MRAILEMVLPPKNRLSNRGGAMPLSHDDQTAAIDQLLRRLEKLHSSPAVALRIMEITRDPDFDIAKVTACLEHDPSLTAAVLRLVNSSYYGLPVKVTEIQRAIGYLGRRSLRLTVLGFGLTKALARGCPKAIHQQYWRRSLTLAVAARKLAERTADRGVNPDVAFAAGLLADLGMLVLAQLETEEYLLVCEAGDHVVTQLVREREKFGFTHVEVGTRLMEEWNLPSELIEAVTHHHKSPVEAQPLSHVLKAANLLAEVLWTTESPHMRLLLPLLKTRFDLGVDDLIILATECKRAVEESVEIFQVRLDDEIDVEALQREARTLYEAAVFEISADLDSHEDIGDHAAPARG
jgi:putative nucleotidyltransferase with HDIG domain